MGLLPYGASTEVINSTRFENRSVSFKNAVRSSEFWLLISSLFCYGFCFLAFQVHIAVYSNDIGVSATGAAMILTVLGAATLVGQIVLGGMGDKIGYKKAYIIGLFCGVLAILTILFARELWLFFVFAALLGLSFGNCSTQESPLVAWLFGMASHGILLGAAAFFFTCGGAIGPLVFGVIYDAQGNYQYAFWIAGILSIIAMILSIFLKQAVDLSSEKESMHNVSLYYG